MKLLKTKFVSKDCLCYTCIIKVTMNKVNICGYFIFLVL